MAACRAHNLGHTAAGMRSRGTRERMGAWSLAAASMIMLCISFNVEAVEGFSVPLAMALDPAPGMKIIVCQGSSCLGKCRGMFNPKTSIEAEKAKGEGGAGIDIEEVRCMNMCKRGPNVRLVQGGELVTIDDKMNETERRRKAFQGVGNEARALGVWELALKLADGSVDGTKHGAVPDDMML
ncbi:hypothetical protein T484DRAFT_1878534 [Baffinella frigidus]|nr:hypothetical protein T484DRAFT_1878534 [Cryptophyta sp. CCMP2293]